MQGIAKLCILAAVIAFLVAAAEALFMGQILGMPPESFSRAANNLALIGIGLAVVFRDTEKAAE